LLAITTKGSRLEQPAQTDKYLPLLRLRKRRVVAEEIVGLAGANGRRGMTGVMGTDVVVEAVVEVVATGTITGATVVEAVLARQGGQVSKYCLLLCPPSPNTT